MTTSVDKGSASGSDAKDQTLPDDNERGAGASGEDDGRPWEFVQRRKDIRNEKRPMVTGANHTGNGTDRRFGQRPRHEAHGNFVFARGNDRSCFWNGPRENNATNPINMKSSVKPVMKNGYDSTKGGIGCTPKTFKEMLLVKSGENTPAKYYQPESDGVEMYARVNSNARLNNKQKWKSAIYLYVVGKRPYYIHLKAYIERSWGLKGAIEIFSRENGFYLVKFDLEEDLLKVIDGGPWMFDGKPMIIKKWEANLKLDRVMLLTLPIWTRMPHLNLSLWDEENICRLASVLGRPIRLDEPTKKASRLNYARVLVGMSIESTATKIIKAKTENGEIYKQEIEFEFIPPCCEQCKCFGHSKNICPLTVRCGKCLDFGHESEKCNKIWVPVSKSTDRNPTGSTKENHIAGNCTKINNDAKTSNEDGNKGEHSTPSEKVQAQTEDSNKMPASKSNESVPVNINIEIDPNIIHSESDPGDESNQNMPQMKSNESVISSKSNEHVPVTVSNESEISASSKGNDAGSKSYENIPADKIITSEDINEAITVLQNQFSKTPEENALAEKSDNLSKKQDSSEIAGKSVSMGIQEIRTEIFYQKSASSEAQMVHSQKEADVEAIQYQGPNVPVCPVMSEPLKVHQESTTASPSVIQSSTSSLEKNPIFNPTFEFLHTTCGDNNSNINNEKVFSVQVAEPRGGMNVQSDDEYDILQSHQAPEID